MTPAVCERSVRQTSVKVRLTDRGRQPGIFPRRSCLGRPSRRRSSLLAARPCYQQLPPPWRRPCAAVVVCLLAAAVQRRAGRAAGRGDVVAIVRRGSSPARFNTAVTNRSVTCRASAAPAAASVVDRRTTVVDRLATETAAARRCSVHYINSLPRSSATPALDSCCKLHACCDAGLDSVALDMSHAPRVAVPQTLAAVLRYCQSV